MHERKECLARQIGDQMFCTPCGLVWDVNDPEPPKCRNGRVCASCGTELTATEVTLLKSRKLQLLCPECYRAAH